MPRTKFLSAIDAANFAVTLANEWQADDGKIFNTTDLHGLLSVADEHYEIDADDEDNYYFVDEDGSVGFTGDGEKTVCWIAKSTKTTEISVDKRAVCPSCGAETKPEHKFCLKCGQSLSAPSNTTADVEQTQEETSSNSVDNVAFAPTEASVSTPSNSIKENKPSKIEKLFAENKNLRTVLITLGVLLAAWLTVWIAQAVYAKNAKATPFVFRLISFLTFANGGISKNILFIVGGWLGKAVFVATLLAITTGGYKVLGRGFSTIIGTVKRAKEMNTLSSLLFGAGAGCILFNLFVGSATFSLAIIGIASAILVLWYLGEGAKDIAFVNKVAAKMPEGSTEICCGAVAGFVLPVLIYFVGWCLSSTGIVIWGFLPYCLGAVCVIAAGILALVAMNKQKDGQECDAGKAKRNKTTIAIALALALVILVLVPLTSFIGTTPGGGGQPVAETIITNLSTCSTMVCLLFA